MIKATIESTTLKLVLASLATMNYQWLSGSVEASLTEYGTATGIILAIWLGRETKQAYFKDQ